MARVIIVGAGIGGLTATVALEQAGFEVCAIERAARFGQVGAGVQIGPNAINDGNHCTKWWRRSTAPQRNEPSATQPNERNRYDYHARPRRP